MQPLFLQVPEPTRAEVWRAFLDGFWPILVPVVLGFLGIYWLLPKARRSKPIWAGMIAGLALALAGLWMVRYEGVWPERILFYAFSGLAIAGGGMMISQSNPVHAALSFALVVLSTCGLFLLLAAPFLMAATIIIYAGAIVVTFLFVIMLAQQEGQGGADARSREPFLATLAGFVLLGSMAWVLEKTYDPGRPITTNAADPSAKPLTTEDLLDRTKQLSEAKSIDEANRILGGAGKGKASDLVTDLNLALPNNPWAANLEEALLRNNLSVIQKTAGVLREKLILSKGSLESDRGTPDKLGVLPASNVAALGKSLFTVYLVPVLMAGVLLLVATIGAIAVAGRRAEELR